MSDRKLTNEPIATRLPALEAAFDAGRAAIDPALLEATVRVGRRVERTRLVPLDDPFRDETLASLDALGYELSTLRQILDLQTRSWFPFKSMSFLARGDLFYAPTSRGSVVNVHAAWRHVEQRFDLLDAHERPAWMFDALTKVTIP